MHLTCFVFVLLFPINAKALTGNVVIECGKNQLNVGETATCYVRCKNFNDSVSSFHGVLVADSNLSIFDIIFSSVITIFIFTMPDLDIVNFPPLLILKMNLIFT